MSFHLVLKSPGLDDGLVAHRNPSDLCWLHEGSPRIEGLADRIVDDDSGVRQSISSLVRSVGFRAALKHADCLILHVRMPGINRGSTCKNVLRKGPDAFLLFFATGYADEDAQRKVFINGAVALLYKPFADEAAFAAVHVALSE